MPKAIKEIQPVSSDENIEDNSEKTNKIIPVRIVLNGTKVSEENNDIEVSFRQALNRGSKNEANENKVNETMQGAVMAVNKTMESTLQDNKTTTPQTTTKTGNNLQNITELTTTEASGLYPTAVYNEQVVDTLTITNGPPNSFLLPPLLDEEWKNFTVSANINVTKSNTTVAMEKTENSTTSQSVNETDSTIKGPYPAALYHNAEIDQVSITTNSYTNESPLPPPRDDRWRSFSSLGEMFSTSSEFRPLAGLYYDGFLHRPLPNRNPGFVPYNQYFVYQ